MAGKVVEIGVVLVVLLVDMICSMTFCIFFFICSFCIFAASLLNNSFHSFLLLSKIFFSGVLLQLNEESDIFVAQIHMPAIMNVKLLTSTHSQRVAERFCPATGTVAELGGSCSS